VGTRDDAPTIASPLHKQVFDLRTGLCLDTKGAAPASLRVWVVVEQDGDVLLDLTQELTRVVAEAA
jgi:nitrite reductase (NADH) small subunit